MGGLTFEATPLPGLQLVRGPVVGDARGRFERVFDADAFAALRPDLRWAQVNLSRTFRAGTVRGMHFQHPPAAEAKLVGCVRGRVFDVAVDLRAGSPTFLRWHGVVLDEAEPVRIFIPEGFAHGFQALTDDVQLLYFHTAAWSPAHEDRVRFDEPRVGIAWPLPVAQLSDKDRDAAPLSSAFDGVPA
jgi:dTDP-4-dehydrorhamnose 3,5-epimerase